MSKLVEVLRAEFSDTELHAIALFSRLGEARNSDAMGRIRNAAIEAADCVDCKTAGR